MKECYWIHLTDVNIAVERGCKNSNSSAFLRKYGTVIVVKNVEFYYLNNFGAIW